MMAFGSVLLTMAVLLVERALRRFATPQNFEDAVGSDVGEFAKQAAKRVEEYLLEQKESLGNGPIQKLVMAKLLDTVPRLPDWDERTNGKEYLQRLWAES